jgi:hypothetical protein
VAETVIVAEGRVYATRTVTRTEARRADPWREQRERWT